LALDFLVVSTQPVNAENVQKLTGFHPFHHLLYRGHSKSFPDCLSIYGIKKERPAISHYSS
jgi:hypothetical protein